MNGRHRSWIVETVCLLFAMAGSSARAEPITLTFEDLPESKLYDGGREPIGGFYPGLTFGPAVYGGRGTNPDYPPHSGTTRIGTDFDHMWIEFARSITSFGVWYKSVDPLPVTFFDASDALLGSVTGHANLGRSDQLQFWAAGIRRVVFTGQDPGLFALDDVSYTPVPEPATLSLVGAAAAASLYKLRRRRRSCRSSSSPPCR